MDERKDMREWKAFMDKYAPDADKSDGSTVYAYAVARTMVQCSSNAAMI